MASNLTKAIAIIELKEEAKPKGKINKEESKEGYQGTVIMLEATRSNKE